MNACFESIFLLCAGWWAPAAASLEPPRVWDPYCAQAVDGNGVAEIWRFGHSFENCGFDSDDSSTKIQKLRCILKAYGLYFIVCPSVRTKCGRRVNMKRESRRKGKKEPPLLAVVFSYFFYSQYICHKHCFLEFFFPWKPRRRKLRLSFLLRWFPPVELVFESIVLPLTAASEMQNRAVGNLIHLAQFFQEAIL